MHRVLNNNQMKLNQKLIVFGVAELFAVVLVTIGWRLAVQTDFETLNSVTQTWYGAMSLITTCTGIVLGLSAIKELRN